ncbi:MAG: hypothetical protein ABI778_01000, partial [Ignavibacteriota bacterium]
IYDTAVMMLREFIREGNDSNLGFKNFDELDSAYLKIDEGINVYYLIEDSLLRSTNPLDSHLVKLGRRIFPVYYHDQLRSAITFDTTRTGWRPAVFDAGDIIAPYIAQKILIATAEEVAKSFFLVEAPFVHNDLIFEHDSTGDHVLPTTELKRELGSDYPTTAPMALIKPIDKNDFLDHLKQHMRKVHGN